MVPEPKMCNGLPPNFDRTGECVFHEKLEFSAIISNQAQNQFCSILLKCMHLETILKF